jgi:hypothetical protein
MKTKKEYDDLLMEKIKQILSSRGITEDVIWANGNWCNNDQEGLTEFSCGCCIPEKYKALVEGVVSGQLYFFFPQDLKEDYSYYEYSKLCK